MSLKSGVNALTKVGRVVAVLLSVVWAGLFAYFWVIGEGALKDWGTVLAFAVPALFVAFVGGWVLDKFVE
jgi:hypothetical protein